MKIRHLVHSCLLVEIAGRRLLVDPGGFSIEAVRGLGPEVLAGPETAALLTEPSDDATPLPAAKVLTLSAGHEHELPALDGQAPVRLRAVGGRHAIIHPDIPRVGNCGLTITAGDAPRLGITGDSLEPVQEFHGIDVLAFAVVAPWSKMAETIDFLRAVNPVLALPVHDAIASDLGRPIFLRQSTNLAPEGTEVRDWPADGLVEITEG